MKISVEALVSSFATYRTEVNDALGQVEQLLAAGEYAKAERAMAIIAQRQAQAAVSMRTVLLRAGHIRETDPV